MYVLRNLLTMWRGKQWLNVMEFPIELVLILHHLFGLFLHTNKGKEKLVFAIEETNDQASGKRDLHVSHQQVFDFVVVQVFHAASIHCGSTKSLDLRRDDRLVDQKIDDDVGGGRPIQ